MAARSVAMYVLQHKSLDGDDRIEEPVSPLGITDRLTRRLNGLGLELGGPVGLETLKHGCHTRYHGGLSRQLWNEGLHHDRRDGHRQSAQLLHPERIVLNLMPFRSNRTNVPKPS